MCECCNYIKDLQKIENRPEDKPGIKHILKVRLITVTKRKGIKRDVGTINWRAFDLNYCPMCGRKLKEGDQMIEKIIEAMQDLTEGFKEKEYVCYYKINMGFLEKVYLTKKELVKFINRNKTAELEVYKIKDKVKIERKIKIKDGD